MSRVTVSLLVMVMLGVPLGASGAAESERDREVAAALRALLAQVESGALSEDDLASLLLADFATVVVRPPGGNLEHPPDDGIDSLTDEAAERGLQLSSAIASNTAIMIGSTPVATLSSPLVIPAAAFTTDGFNPDSAFFFFTGFWQGNAAAYGCIVAPAALPRGVTVTDMFASVYDNDAVAMTVALRRVDNFTGASATMASASTSGTFAGVQVISDASIDNPSVLYPDYSYYVTTCLGSSSLRLYSVRLYFSP